MSKIDSAALQAWIGKRQTRTDVINEAAVAGLCAALDYPQPRAAPGDALPPVWHWLYFHEPVPTSELGVDGHPRRGGFLPPISLPRRMWAGSRIKFSAPVHVGEEVRRESLIADISHKKGRSGELVFVTLQHRLYSGDRLLLEEEQDLVYREAVAASAASTPGPAPASAQWSRQLEPDSVLLFRYSALTFNSHRIHYDRDYAVSEESYPALVVQGPLTATLLLDLLHRELPGAVVVAFDFRGVRPLFEGQVLQLQGRRDGQAVQLWALDASGALAMEARAQLG